MLDHCHLLATYARLPSLFNQVEPHNSTNGRGLSVLQQPLQLYGNNCRSKSSKPFKRKRRKTNKICCVSSNRKNNGKNNNSSNYPTHRRYRYQLQRAYQRPVPEMVKGAKISSPCNRPSFARLPSPREEQSKKSP